MSLVIDKNFADRNRIERLRRNANDLERQWLVVNGWQATCQTPGSYWMFRKEVNPGVTYMVDQDTAARIQSVFTCQDYYNIHPELDSD